jgi:hypothetical protein
MKRRQAISFDGDFIDALLDGAHQRATTIVGSLVQYH